MKSRSHAAFVTLKQNTKRPKTPSHRETLHVQIPFQRHCSWTLMKHMTSVFRTCPDHPNNPERNAVVRYNDVCMRARNVVERHVRMQGQESVSFFELVGVAAGLPKRHAAAQGQA